MFLVIKNKIKKFSYGSFFNLDEIYNSRVLQAFFYVVLLSFFVTFYSWVEKDTVSISSFLNALNVCPPYFQSCGNYYFLESLPYGYSQGFFYVFLFFLLMYGFISALKNNWRIAHESLLVAFIWKVIYLFILSYGVGGNFDYYDVILALVWLFSSQKEYFLRVTFVFFYFLASTIKIHEGWIFGNYFTATIIGAPFFSNHYLPIFTNFVILMQIAGCWFLLSKNKTLQKLAFAYFLMFHAYSGIIVNYRYITISVTALVVLFGYNFKLFQIEDERKNFKVLPFSRQTFFGYTLLCFLLLCQSSGLLIPGDQKKTMEGNFYGLYMFEANHQCISSYIVKYDNGKENSFTLKSSIANNRCDLYSYWYKLKRVCDLDKRITSIKWTFDHSINGHPFERIVSEENACTLDYKNLTHNKWIKLDGEAQVLPQTVYKNGYAKNLNINNILQKTNPIVNNNLYTKISYFYWFLWFLVLGTTVSFLFFQTLKSLLE